MRCPAIWRSVVCVLSALLAAGFGSSAYGQNPKEANHVYFLLAIDTLTPDYKDLGLDLDRDNLVSAIRGAMKEIGYAEGPQGRYTIKILQDRMMSEKTVLDYFRTLKTTPNDTLVFYYTGHGGFYPEKGHLLAMRNFYNNQDGSTSIKGAVVDRKELLAAMARHNPRAIIALTDCCASTNVPLIAGGQRVQMPKDALKSQLNGQGKGEVARDLFFRSSGVINITAARTGTPARGQRIKNGSHFTVALWKLLKEGPQLFDTDKNGQVEWREFYPSLSTLTELESLRFFKDRKGNPVPDFHTPEAFSLGETERKDAGVTPVAGKGFVLAVDGELKDTDPSYKKGNGLFYIKEHPVPMSKDKAYLITLHSSHFDTFAFVKDQNGKTLAFNDDYGNTTTRSRILFYPPADGSYRIGVSSYGPKETGKFSLTIQESAFRDALTNKDRLDRYCLGAHVRTHPVRLTALRSYTIQLESNDFDAYLRVEDEFGNTIALNDDEDESQNRLNSMLTFRTLSTGTYYIVATTFQPGRQGRYAVFLQE